jgi:hypothetical protein
MEFICLNINKLLTYVTANVRAGHFFKTPGMIACHFLRCLILAIFLMPVFATSQIPAQHAFDSNVPLNEISVKAFRHFQRLFPTGATGEYWFKSTEGYKVSFNLNAHNLLAYFDKHGAFLCTMKYYTQKEIPRETGELVKSKYPGYGIDMVTEVFDGQTTFLRVQISNASSLRILCIYGERIYMTEDLINGGTAIGSVTAGDVVPVGVNTR